ncbi:phosphopyruvate hydratase, partial [Candidatus Uhrbacteria bacterium CG_4_9_14_3_um_filter_36_7]
MIRSIHAREILDSRGNPTIEVRVHLSDKIIGTAQVPSGASTGIHEALELRDHDKKRYAGKGVLKAVNNVNSVIQKILLGKSVFDQRIIDELLIKLDATENKSHLGANAILGVSLACAHAGAKARSLPLYKYLREIFELSYESYSFPFATMNVLNGGAHAGWILDFQEFMIVPTQRSFKERVRCGSEIFHTLGALLSKKGYTTAVGDEGGYAVPFKKNEEALLFLTKAVREAGYIPGKNIFFALDPASSEFYDSKKKVYSLKRDGKQFTSEELISYYELLIKKYPIISLEDGLSEDDWQGWKEMTKRL